MPANYNLNTQPLARSSNDSINTDSRSFVPVRVKKVILDNTDPEYVKYGSSEAVGVIKYSKLSDDTDDSGKEVEALKEAYPLTSSFRTLPLVNEIVLLLKAPAPSIRSSANNSRTYYTTIVSMWNHPNHSGYPVGDTLELGEDIEEGVDINPLQPFPGDIILDGRQGQSIRMGGYKAQSNTFTDDSNQGKPLTLISNGQKLIDNSFTPIVEDINEDASSIYLLSDHSSKLVQANFKRVTYDKKPATAQDYKGSQVIINGGRLFFNAKNESALISAAESVGLNANTLNFDAHKYICLDGEAIFLGVGARVAGSKVKQPVVLGHRMETYLSDILDVLIEITTGMSKAKTIKGDPLPGLIDVGSSALKQIKDNLKSQLNPGGISNLKSKKVFTE
jgi:hypothetical protein